MRDGQVDRPGVLAALLPVAAAALVWWPVTGTYFHDDDFLNFYDLLNWPWREFVTYMHGGHLLLTRNLVLLAHHWRFGTNAALYMGTVWLTHLLNVWLLYALVRRLTASRALACVGAALWGTAAVNEGALNWYAVYGQLLALAGVLLVLLGLLRDADRGDARWWTLLPWAALLAAAGASFGVGLAMTLVMPLVAWLWLPRSRGRRRAVALLVLTAAAMAALYLALRPADVAAHGGPLPSAQLAQAYYHATAFAAFFGRLVAYGATALLLGTWYRPALGAGPLAGAAAAATAALLLAGLWRAPAAARRHATGALLLMGSIYALIALGRLFRAGHMDFVVRVSRYHYAAPALLAVAVCVALAQLGRISWLSPRRRALLLAAWAIWAAIGYARGAPLDHFDDARREAAQTMADVAAAARAAPPGTDVYLPMQKFRSVGPMVARALPTFPGNAAVFAIFSPTDIVAGRRVFFVAADARVYAATRSGLRSATLIVAPARP